MDEGRDSRAGGAEGEAGDRVERLVARCIEHLRSAGFDGLDALLRAEPELADDARRRLDGLHRLGLLPAPGGAPRRFGRYEVLATLGRGGMGVVYRVRDDRLGRDLALKALAPHVLPDATARERFRLESRALARLRHGNVVPVHDAGEVDGAPYFTMELVDGITLDQCLAALRTCGVPPAAIGEAELRAAVASERARVHGGTLVEFAVRVAIDVAQALEHAHRHGVMHRDVKPGNVILAADSRALLFDFGVAQLRDEPRVTRNGELLGTLEVLAPELIAGAAAADARSDVFGLGATLYEALTLVQPFRGESAAETLARLEAGDVAPLRELNAATSRDLDVVCRRALQPDPARRYASAAEFAADLQRALRGEPVSARESGPLERALRLWRRRRVRVAAFVAAVAVGAGLTGFSIASSTRDDVVESMRMATMRLDTFERIEGDVTGSRADAAQQMLRELATIDDLVAVLDDALAATSSATLSEPLWRQRRVLARRAERVDERYRELVARLSLRAAMATPLDGEVARSWAQALAILRAEEPSGPDPRPQPEFVPIAPEAGQPLRFWLAFSGSDPALGREDAALVFRRVKIGATAILAGALTPAVERRIGDADARRVLGVRMPSEAERAAIETAGLVGDAIVVRDWR